MASSTAFNPSSLAINNLTNRQQAVFEADTYTKMKNSGEYSMLDGMVLNCVVSRSATYSADIPDYSVENIETDSDGNVTSKTYSYVSDTILRSPLVLDVTIFATNMSTPSDNGTNRVKTVKDALIEKADRGKVFEFVTPHEVYENMVISSLTFPEDDYLNAMEIKISLQQVSFTASTEVEDSSYDYSGPSEADLGTIETSDSTDEVDTEDDTEVSDLTTKELLASVGVDFDNGISVSNATVSSFGSYLGTGSGGTQDGYIQKIISAAQSGLLENCLFFNPNYGETASTTYHYVYYNGYFYKTSLIETIIQKTVLLFIRVNTCAYSTEIGTLSDKGYTFIGENKDYDVYVSIDDYLASR